MNNIIALEVVSDSVQDAIAADYAGVKRIELVSVLEVGGITPDIEMVKYCRKHCNAEIHTMIRPRVGGFAYSNIEFELMQKSIINFADLGVKGVVFGILNADNTFDKERNEALLALARSYQLEVTCHRAFDFSADWQNTLETLISLKFDRILTSGLSANAKEGLAFYPTIIAKANQRIQIMAGGAVDVNTAIELKKLDINAVHFGIKKVPSQADPLSVFLGVNYQTDLEKLQKMVAIFSNQS